MGKIMTGRGWRRLNFGWSCVVMGGGGKIVAGRGCSWMVVTVENSVKLKVGFILFEPVN